MTGPGPSESGPRGWLGEIGPFLTMGLELAIAVVGMFFIGRWVDAACGWAPWGMYTGLVIGVAGGFIRFIRKALAMGSGNGKRGPR